MLIKRTTAVTGSSHNSLDVGCAGLQTAIHGLLRLAEAAAGIKMEANEIRSILLLVRVIELGTGRGTRDRENKLAFYMQSKEESPTMPQVYVLENVVYVSHSLTDDHTGTKVSTT